jgi:cell division protein FtsW (lipid II flippase)
MFDTIEQKPDKKLLLAILALTLFGWIMSSSASVGHFGTFSFALKQGVFILLGVVTGVVILKLPLSFFKKHALLVFGLTLFLKIASNNFLSGFCSIVSNISPAFYPIYLSWTNG